MKLTIKTLQQSTFKVEIEPDKTVKELKDKIETDHGKEYPSGAQKLIYSGKILADESKLAEYNIDEKKFVVLMITRPPPAPKPTAPVATDSKASASKKDETANSSKQTKVASDDTKTKATAGQQQSTATTTTSSSSVSTTNVPSTLPTNTTITTTTAATTRTQQQQQPASNRSNPNSAATLSMGEPQMASRLASLISQPHFRQIQDLIQQSPHLLSSTIEDLAGSDPEMYSFISENPDMFVSALNHPPLAGSRGQLSRGSSGATTTTTAASGQVRAAQPASGGRQQPIVDQIMVSEGDKEAIERLKELGFSEYLAVQAYMACDKDEQLAANLLFQMEQ